MKDWIKRGGIPHDNGKIKWFAIGYEEDESYYVGEYDMTDWDKTFDEVCEKATDFADKCFPSDEWKLIRKDQLEDLMWNVASALRDAGDFKEDWIRPELFDDEEV